MAYGDDSDAALIWPGTFEVFEGIPVRNLKVP
jgi:hypothetical protein